VAYDYRVIGWISSGDGYYSDPSALNTIYYPGGEDRNSGSVDLKLVALPIPPCTGNLISTMHVTFDEFIGIQDPSKKEPAMTIQPNPARGMVTIVVSNPGGDDATLIISDIVGRAIMSAAISTTEKQVIRKIDVSAYPKGIYLVQLKTGGHTRTERLIVQ
jgi:hypothetical protein